MQQIIHSAPNPIRANIHIPGSKSITYRALLLAALAGGVSEIAGLRLDNDIRAFIKILNQLGIVTQLDETTHSCIIAGCNGSFPKKQASLWCGDSVTSLRFLLSACAATSGVYYIDGTAHLRKTAIAELLKILVMQNAQLIPSDIEKVPLTLVGADTLAGGEFTFDQPIANQIISALLLIAPYGRSPLNLTVSSFHHNLYIEMTCMMMAEFGVLVHRIHQGQFMIPVPQRYQARDYIIEPDFSLAAYFFAAAAMTGGELSIPAIKSHGAKHPAAKSLTILKKMGSRIEESHKGITVKGPDVLQGTEVVVRDISDTFLIASALAPFAATPTRFLYREALTSQSTERLAALKTAFTKLNIRFETDHDSLQIYPSKPQGTPVFSHNDPKIAMTLALIGLKVPGIQISDAEKVTKLFPEFFSMWEGLASSVRVKA